MSDLLTRNRHSVPLDRATVAADWTRRGYSCNLFVDPPGQQWLGFVHQCNELVTVVDGRLDMSVGETRFLVQPGDVVLIPKGAVHSVRNAHPGISLWLYGYD